MACFGPFFALKCTSKWQQSKQVGHFAQCLAATAKYKSAWRSPTLFVLLFPSTLSPHSPFFVFILFFTRCAPVGIHHHHLHHHLHHHIHAPFSHSYTLPLQLLHIKLRRNHGNHWTRIVHFLCHWLGILHRVVSQLLPTGYPQLQTQIRPRPVARLYLPQRPGLSLLLGFQPRLLLQHHNPGPVPRSQRWAG